MGEMKKIGEILSITGSRPQESQDGGDEARRAAMRVATSRAAALAIDLGKLFPAVAASLRDSASAAVWAEAWGRQILSHKLTDAEMTQGLSRVADVVVARHHPPLSFAIFLEACRPDSHLTGQDAEARKTHPALLTRDRTQDAGWCSARDACMEKLRARGWKV